MKAAVLFARSDSIYKSIPELDVYDIERDARNYAGQYPVIAHPPCRGYGRLRKFARPRPDELQLGLFAVEQVRLKGGVLEHPECSTLWEVCDMPKPSAGEIVFDEFGGWTLAIAQYWFGHRAYKKTWLYICGVNPKEIPDIPLVLGEAPCVIGSSLHTAGAVRRREEITRSEREHTPAQFAHWLVDLVGRVNVSH